MMIISLVRICRGTDSGWEVTARVVDKKKRPPAAGSIPGSGSFSESLSQMGMRVPSKIDLESLARQVRVWCGLGVRGARKSGRH
eukprot:scaffold6484_cov51-Isochrysis_galbana.AAC.1